ncbi:hypothetical protein HanIR_Chr11g0554661 [Helianthus annuus]|nr:hypothetical protein HanIR_Chr11g0554661 [Helianthus annuus]
MRVARTVWGWRTRVAESLTSCSGVICWTGTPTHFRSWKRGTPDESGLSQEGPVCKQRTRFWQ